MPCYAPCLLGATGDFFDAVHEHICNYRNLGVVSAPKQRVVDVYRTYGIHGT